nr:alpha/beta hydrolase [Sphingosinicella soli]
MPWEDRYWTSRDGLRLHYRDYSGSDRRPPLLCLPGLSRNCRDFEDLAERLSPAWRVIAPSLRGRGRSEHAADSDSYVPQTYVDDLLCLLSDLDLGSVVVVGTSLGARLAMLMAAQQPRIFVGAILNDLGPELPVVAQAGIGSRLGNQPRHWPGLFQAIEALSALHAEAHPHFDANDWTRLVSRVCREEADGSLSLDYDPKILSTYANAAPPTPEEMWQGFEALCAVPVLSIRGSLSTLLTPGIQAMMVHRAPRAILTATIPGVGHAPTLDEPEAVFAINALLDRIVAEAANGSAEKGGLDENHRIRASA